MTIRLTILLFITSVLSAWAQEQDLTMKPVKPGISGKRLLPKTDSILTIKINKTLDSIAQANAKLQRDVDQPKTLPSAVIDSTQKKLSTSEVQVAQLEFPNVSSYSQVDSIPLNKIDNARQNVQGKIDEASNKVMDKIGVDQSDVAEKLNANTNVPTSEKLTLLSNVLSNQIQFPNQDFPASPSLPDSQLPDLNIPMNDVTPPRFPDTTIGNLNAITDKAVGAIGGMSNKVDAIKHEGENGKGVLGQVEGVQQEVKSVQENGAEGIAQSTEKRINEVPVVNTVKRKVAPATQKQAEYEAMIRKYQDTKQVEAELKRKMQNVANEQINQFSPEVKAVMTDMGKKKKLLNAKHVGDSIKHRRYNVMAGKPIGRRLLPGITFQMINRNVYSMDLGLQLGYRFTGSLTAGMGASYRVGVSKKFEQYVQGLDVISGRIYGDLALGKGWFPHAEFTWTNCAFYDLKKEMYEPRDVLATNVGIGKSYKLSKRLGGYALLLYRFEWQGELKDQSKLNLRVGFNFDMKKRRTRVINDVRIKL